MKNLNNLIIALGITFTLRLLASEKVPSLLRAKTRFPVIVAGEAPVQTKKTPQTSNEIRLPAIIDRAHAQVSPHFDKNCPESIIIEKNKFLFKNTKLVFYLSCLDLLNKIPRAQFNTAVNLFKERTSGEISSEIIEKACVVWNYNPKKICVSHKKQEIALRKLLAKKVN